MARPRLQQASGAGRSITSANYEITRFEHYDYPNRMYLHTLGTMKIRSLLVFLILLPACIGRTGESDDDHLVPFRPSVYDELLPTLYRKLCVTPANYGRMIELPAGPEQAEQAVSVYCDKSPARGDTCGVTLTRAAENLDYIMQEKRGKEPLRAVNKVKVIRKDASLPRTTASAVRAAWLSFLRKSKPSSSRPDDPILLHATKTEFWVVVPGKAIRSEIPRNPGKSVMELITIGRLLVNYCEEPESARGRLAKKIETEASQLTTRTEGGSR